MRFSATALAGAFLIDIDPVEDERGLFARTMCADDFAAHGLNASWVQQSVSWNRRAGTLRGLHFQCAPDAEIKLVRVTRGAIFDVIVDLRPGSASYGKTFHTELSAANRRQMYIPAGMAHGFQSLTDDTEVLYQMSAPFRAASARGLRWDDAALAIPWPACAAGAARTISDNDRAWPLLAGLTDNLLCEGTP
jgi:dTDP-4-dehydrorhamnose 3,5-epimerase